MSGYAPFDPAGRSVASVAASHAALGTQGSAERSVASVATSHAYIPKNGASYTPFDAPFLNIMACDVATLATLQPSDELHDADPNAWLTAVAGLYVANVAACEAEQLRQAERAQAEFRRTGRTVAFGDDGRRPMTPPRPPQWSVGRLRPQRYVNQPRQEDEMTKYNVGTSPKDTLNWMMNMLKGAPEFLPFYDAVAEEEANGVVGGPAAREMAAALFGIMNTVAGDPAFPAFYRAAAEEDDVRGPAARDLAGYIRGLARDAAHLAQQKGRPS